MNPEDRVLIGVINRKRDFMVARDDGWYRIPQEQLPRGFHFEYMGFFLSGKTFKDQSGGIHYFCPVRGVELAYRRDLIPDQPNHPRAQNQYYRVELTPLQPKTPPILNPTKRAFAFIQTTWDRFIHATTIADLFSTSDYFVDRIYHVLKERGIAAQPFWELDQSTIGFTGLRVLCENGSANFFVNTSGDKPAKGIFLDQQRSDDRILAQIRAEIAKQGGPLTINVPMDDD